MFIASFRPRFGKEIIEGPKSKPILAFPSRVDCYVRRFLSLTGVDDARKLTIRMMANIGPGEAIGVKYVLNAS
jgi:hypothetical protein